MKNYIILIFVLTLLGCKVTTLVNTNLVTTKETTMSTVSRRKFNQNNPSSPFLNTALVVVELLKNKDFLTLSDYVHPVKGVRFSPYGYIDTQKHLVFNSLEVKSLFENTKIYTWGDYDGSGEPINLTFLDYYKEFVFDLDFTNPHIIGNNVSQSKGSTYNNLKEVYSNASFVEFHFTGVDPNVEGMDWRSLRIVLEQLNNQWYMVGIIHDEWTI